MTARPVKWAGLSHVKGRGGSMSDGTEKTNFDEAVPIPGGAYGKAVAVMGAIGTLWIFMTMTMIVADVLGRNFFNAPITGVAEVAGRSVVAIVFLQIAGAIMAGRMTRADFLLNILSKRSPSVVKLLDLFNAVLGIVVFGLIAAASWPDLRQAWLTADFFGVQGLFTIPTWPFWAITVIGSIAAAIAYGLAMVERMRAA